MDNNHPSSDESKAKIEALKQEDKSAPCLRKFDRQKKIDSINGALALRPQIEKIVDEIWENNFDNIFFVGIGGTWASSMQVEVYMRGKTNLPVFVENASEFLTTGNKKLTEKSVVIYSTVSGTTTEMIDFCKTVKAQGTKVFAFIDTPNTTLTQPEYQDYLIIYPENEQLKFYMIANYLMFKNGDFPDYEEYNKQMEEHLANNLANIEEQADVFGYEFAKAEVERIKVNPNLPRYFVGAGNNYGSTYSYAMCYWEEQMWIRTKSISAPEFFHGMLEIIEDDTPVTVFIGEDEQRPLSLKVAKFLPKINNAYTIIDSKDYDMPGIDDKYRPSISHHILRSINNRVDCYMELFLEHPLNIRRYYRQVEY